MLSTESSEIRKGLHTAPQLPLVITQLFRTTAAYLTDSKTQCPVIDDDAAPMS